MMIERGSEMRVRDVAVEGATQFVMTEDAVAFALREPAPLKPGDRFEIGPVCGEWAFLIVHGERYRARIIAST